MLDKTQCFELGSVAKVHGLKGHITLYIDSDDPSKYFNMESVFLEDQGNLIPFFIQSLEPLKGNLVKVLFEDIHTVDQASALVKKRAFLPLTLLPSLPDDQFYFHEIEGYAVVAGGEPIGTIQKVLDFSGNPMFEILGTEDQEILVPIQDEFIVALRKTTREIELELPEGLIDLQD